MRNPSSALLWAATAALVLSAVALAFNMHRQKLNESDAKSLSEEAFSERLAQYGRFDPPRTNVLFGDSLVAHAQWDDILPGAELAVRAFPGATSGDLLDHVGFVTSLSPQRVFLLVGTNDMMRGVDAEELANNVARLRARLERDGIEVVTFSVPHCDCRSSQAIRSYNARHPADVDLATALDQVDTPYRNDGIHLSSASYAAWKELIEPRLAKADPPD